MVQTGEVFKKQEALIKRKGEETQRHHVSAIIDVDFWQVMKEEKLQEGDFHVESSMSIGSSHWCRSTPPTEHRLTPLAESVGLCETVRIERHSNFTSRHPYSPMPFCVKTKDIDQHQQEDTDRHQHAGNDRHQQPRRDRHQKPSRDRQPPLTY